MHSCSSNTYPIILLLKACISQILAVALFIFHSKLYVNTCTVELLTGGVHAMKDVVLTKWRIALSINLGVLDNH